MKFNWNMDINDFEKLKETLASDTYRERDCYGQVSAGKICVDILTTENDTNKDGKGKANILDVNEYAAGIDGGYGELSDGTPYDLLDGLIDTGNINMDGTFEEFKESVETELINSLKDDADRTAWANEDYDGWFDKTA
jgi:hypothetical protein